MVEKIKLGCFDFPISKAQSKVINNLLDKENAYVLPTKFYNHQNLYAFGCWQFQFTKPTLNWLRDRHILIPDPNNDKRLILSPLLKTQRKHNKMGKIRGKTL